MTAPQEHADPIALVFHQGALWCHAEPLRLPRASELGALDVAQREWHAVGLLDGNYYQTTWIDHAAPATDGYAWRPLRSLFGALGDDQLGIAARAAQLAEWARTHRHCGACGAPMQLVGGERCMRCTRCPHLAYPRISPAMMVLIRKGDAVLLALHTHSPTRRYSALAGFLEAGESIEEAVHREVFEEVGLRVHNLRYFMSQSWPFPHSLMIAFTADYLDGEICIDPNEIESARWFGPGDDWPPPVTSHSIAALLIDAHRPR